MSALPLDPFNRTRLPRALDRVDRVRALAEVAHGLLYGEAIDTQAAAFVGAALLCWLDEGGDLARDRLQVTGPPKSHRTAQWVHRQLHAGSHPDDSRSEQPAAQSQP